MAPEPDGEKWTLFNSMNGNGAELTGEAAGIVVCLMAYSHHACRTECDADELNTIITYVTSRYTIQSAAPLCISIDCRNA